MPEEKIAVTLQFGRSTIEQLEQSFGPDWPRRVEAMIARQAAIRAERRKDLRYEFGGERPASTLPIRTATRWRRKPLKRYSGLEVV